MILGINAIRLVVARSGVARCIEALLRSLDELDHPFSEIRVYTPSALDSATYLPRGAVNVVLPTRFSYAFWEQVTLPRAHGRRGLLLCPSYVLSVTARCPTFLIHHGSYEGYPRAFGWWKLNKARAVYALSAWLATRVSTVSEYSRRDMQRFYRVPLERIHVVPEGVDTRQFKPMDDTVALSRWRAAVLGDDVPYIAYVGKPTERRNLSALIRAFAQLRAKWNVPHQLLIVGADLPGTSPFRKVIAELGLERDVTIVGHASHQEMVYVYNAASLFIYPSSYEGFGMPVLEAMACGAPVIALDNTAFPEFAGGVAHLLPDAREETLVEGMRYVLNNPELRRRMAVEGPRRAAAYDWRLITRRYLDLMIPLAERHAATDGGASPGGGRQHSKLGKSQR
jgi:glycosyltransferase involved in cell wall biosynthesis